MLSLTIKIDVMKKLKKVKLSSLSVGELFSFVYNGDLFYRGSYCRKEKKYLVVHALCSNYRLLEFGSTYVYV